MPSTAGNTVSNLERFLGELARMRHRLDALAGMQTTYLGKGNSYYVLDDNGNTVFILGEISAAPMGVGTSSPSTTSTGLSGRGAASFKTGTWTQI